MPRTPALSSPGSLLVLVVFAACFSVCSFGAERRDWLASGALPIDSEFAAAIADYRVTRYAKPYWDRDVADQCVVEVDLASLAQQEYWAADEADMKWVVGWIYGGEAVSIAEVDGVGTEGRSDWLQLWIPAETRSGYPLVWFARDGELVAKPSGGSWDAVFVDGEEPDFEALSKQSDANGRSALHFAAANGDVAVARGLVEGRPELVDGTSELGDRPIDLAVACGRLEMCRFLAERDLREDVYSSLGAKLALHAAEHGHTEIVKAFFGKSDVKDGNSYVAYSLGEIAVKENQLEICDYLAAIGAPMELAVRRRGALVSERLKAGQVDMALWIVRIGGVKTKELVNGESLLASAAAYADGPLLERLKKARFPIDGSVIEAALEAGNEEALRWLGENGAKRLVVKEPLRFAKAVLKSEEITCVRWLDTNGLGMSDELEDGLTLLMRAYAAGAYGFGGELRKAGGRWALSSKEVDGLVVRLLRADEADAIAALVEDGWAASRRVDGDFSLGQLAAFFGAEATLGRLRDLGWGDGDLEPLAEGDGLEELAVKELEVEVSPLDSYGVERQEVGARIAVTAKGRVAFVEVGETALAGVIRGEVAARLSGLSFGKRGQPWQREVWVTVRPAEVSYLDQTDVKPRQLSLEVPRYPKRQVIDGTEGRVMVNFVIEADGSVGEARVKSSPHPLFSELALEAVRKSRWHPAEKDGKAVRCVVVLPFAFKLMD